MLRSCPNVIQRTEPDTQDTAIHLSIHPERIEILEELLKASIVPIDKLNVLKRTPLHLPAIYGYERAMLLLIDHHAQLDGQMEQKCSTINLR